MKLKWVTQVRRDRAGRVGRVMWRNVELNTGSIGLETEADVVEVMDAIRRGEVVKVGLLGEWSANLRVAPASDGYEAIADDERALPGHRLVDLPEF